MTRNQNPKRNPTLDIIGVALIGVLIYWIVLPPSEQSGPEYDEEQVPEAPPPATFLFSADGIKALSPSIRDAKLTPLGDPVGARKVQSYQIDITMDKVPTQSGARDWNAVAHDVRSISGILLKSPEPLRINYSFTSPEQGHPEWARIGVSRERMPEDWPTLSYLKFFSVIEPEAPTRESRTWLCEFYRHYENARPEGNLPEFCEAR